MPVQTTIPIDVTIVVESPACPECDDGYVAYTTDRERLNVAEYPCDTCNVTGHGPCDWCGEPLEKHSIRVEAQGSTDHYHEGTCAREAIAAWTTPTATTEA